jgi:drug/metabolite transporter (DMT)-like permease
MSAVRRARIRLGAIGVPLALTASFTAGLWWTALPLAVCAWWWSPRHTGLEWVGAIGRGVVGTAWVLAGSSAFVSFPDRVLMVGAFWLLGAGLLVGGSSVLARRVFHTETLNQERRRNGVQMRLTGVPSVRKRFAMHLTIQRMPASRKRS